MSQPDWSKAPEGATHYNDVNCMFYKLCNDMRYIYWSDRRAEWVQAGFQDEYNSKFIPRPITPQWNGTGLPPVGTVCEFREYCGTWAECTIIGEFKGRIICGCNATGTVGYIDLEELRHIRTPEQIAADEREAAIDEMWRVYWQPGTPTAKQALGLLWDAGYRKQSTKQDDQQ